MKLNVYNLYEILIQILVSLLYKYKGKPLSNYTMYGRYFKLKLYVKK